MYIDIVPNRNSPPAILLRESLREGGKVVKRTVANLSSLPMHQVNQIRAILKDQPLVPVDSLFEKVHDQQHGAVQAVLTALKQLKFDTLLDGAASRERDRVVAMVVGRILKPQSKLATERWWSTTTLADELNLEGTTEDELYEAMDWLLERQERIEKRLAKRHLQNDGMVLYDLSSSYLEGTSCPLGALGYSRDGKKGTLQVNYGLLTDERGCPISVSVFKGNTADPTTLLPQVTKVRETFGIERMVIVGDRGMISQKQIHSLNELDGVAWITALKSESIRALAQGGALQMGLFDTRNLFEIEHPDFPGERLVACKNHDLAKLRAHKRESLLAATETEFEKIRSIIQKDKLGGKDKIGVRVGRVVNKYKVAKHFDLTIEEHSFVATRRLDAIAAEAALDGIYVVRTKLEKAIYSADDVVRSYKLLSRVERGFRSIKTVDLRVRPIFHRLENRVRAHIFLTMLAYYVEWHMKEACRPLLFSDESPVLDRDPVAPAKRSTAALRKVHERVTEDGLQLHSFSSLLDNLATISKSTCRRIGDNESESMFTLYTKLSPLQDRAFQLLKQITIEKSTPQLCTQ